jgi:hypothetical protein
MQIDAEILDWLLEGDPAIRWQAQRDLLDEPPQVYEAEPAGGGGGWRRRPWRNSPMAGGAAINSRGFHPYTCWRCDWRPRATPRRWQEAAAGERIFPTVGSTSSPPNTARPASPRGAQPVTFRYPDRRVGALAEHLLRQQMADGGWNCRSYNGDTHSSFNTTILALEGLRMDSLSHGASRPSDAQMGGFLLAHEPSLNALARWWVRR